MGLSPRTVGVQAQSLDDRPRVTLEARRFPFAKCSTSTGALAPKRTMQCSRSIQFPGRH